MAIFGFTSSSSSTPVSNSTMASTSTAAPSSTAESISAPEANSISSYLDTHAERASRFRSFHLPGRPIILTNVYDCITAEACAARPSTRSLATSSFAIAASLGLEDDELTMEHNLGTASRIALVAKKHNLPFTDDIQDGYGDELAYVITKLLDMGAVGCNLEDCEKQSLGHTVTMPDMMLLDKMVKRIELVLRTARRHGVPDFVVNAKTDTLLHEGSIDQAIDRGKAYLEAGATTVLVWAGEERDGLKGDEIEKLVQAFGGMLNAMATAAQTKAIGKMGVARISTGPLLQSKVGTFFGEEVQRVLNERPRVASVSGRTTPLPLLREQSSENREDLHRGTGGWISPAHASRRRDVRNLRSTSDGNGASIFPTPASIPSENSNGEQIGREEGESRGSWTANTTRRPSEMVVTVSELPGDDDSEEMELEDGTAGTTADSTNSPPLDLEAIASESLPSEKSKGKEPEKLAPASPRIDRILWDLGPSSSASEKTNGKLPVILEPEPSNIKANTINFINPFAETPPRLPRGGSPSVPTNIGPLHDLYVINPATSEAEPRISTDGLQHGNGPPPPLEPDVDYRSSTSNPQGHKRKGSLRDKARRLSRELVRAIKKPKVEDDDE